MTSELEAIEKNGTWKLTSLPPGHKAIGLKWVYKLKKDTSGNVVKHKARLVAKGYVQRYGIDYEEVFSPVARIETVRLLLALAAKKGWEVHHLDVKSAFLNGDLQEEVYVSQPEGYVKEENRDKVYRLHKALYGLRQAPRAWNAKLNKCLKDFGFVRCPQEHAVYTRRKAGQTLVVGIYVDDLIVTGTNVAEIKKFKQQMSTQFEMSDLGLLSYYLGIEVTQRDGRISLKQSSYAKRVLEKFGMGDCNSTKIPMEAKLQVGKDEMGTPVDPTEYRRVIGCLRYLTHTRPDLMYSVGYASRYMEKPTTRHKEMVKQILRYVKGTVNHGLLYEKDNDDLEVLGYSDSSYGNDSDGGKSTGGMVFYLNKNPVSWSSQKQKTVALSSCEAEFMAATAAACQGIWLSGLVREITMTDTRPVRLYVDNKSAIDLMKNPVFHGRSKHINIRYHFIRECVEKGEVAVTHVSSEEQRADALTKALAKLKFAEMREMLGVKDLGWPSLA